MKVIVIHDAKGNIRSFAVPASGIPNEKLEPERGHLASEIDVPSVDLQGSPANNSGKKPSGKKRQRSRR